MNYQYEIPMQFVKVKRVQGIEELVKYGQFLLEGYPFIQMATAKQQQLSEDQFIARLCRAAVEPDEFIGIALSKNDKPLAYAVLLDASTEKRKIAFVCGLYSPRGSTHDGVKQLIKQGFEILRQQGYEEVRAYSSRTSGAANRLFTKSWGFERTAILYTKEL